MKQLVIYNEPADMLQLVTVLPEKVIWEYNDVQDGNKVRIEFEGDIAKASLNFYKWQIVLGDL